MCLPVFDQFFSFAGGSVTTELLLSYYKNVGANMNMLLDSYINVNSRTHRDMQACACACACVNE